MKISRFLLLFASLSAPLHAQTIDDGVMMTKHHLFTGGLYSTESWEDYWEGSLKRVNGNIGTITTRTNVWSADYGVTDRFNVIAVVPHVWTHASQGVLHAMQGFQDVTLAAKYSFFERPSPSIGLLRAIAVVSAGTPLTDYSPDFQPLSIGLGSTRVSGRLTVNVLSRDEGWYFNASTAYTLRGNVTLDRPYYFTDGQFFMTDEVEMPNVFDYVVSAGYLKRRVKGILSVTQQRTLGGGDIRRQDAPFVSNRMNFSKVGGTVMYPLPKLTRLEFHFGYAYTMNGRNVGQATTITTGLMYRSGSRQRATQ